MVNIDEFHINFFYHSLIKQNQRTEWISCFFPIIPSSVQSLFCVYQTKYKSHIWGNFLSFYIKTSSSKCPYTIIYLWQWQVYGLTNFCWTSVIIFNCLNKNDIPKSHIWLSHLWVDLCLMCAQMESSTIWEIIKTPISIAYKEWDLTEFWSSTVLSGCSNCCHWTMFCYGPHSLKFTLSKPTWLLMSTAPLPIEKRTLSAIWCLERIIYASRDCKIVFKCSNFFFKIFC